MKLLLRSGADPNTGRNPLLHALSLKHYDICRMLLENRIISPNVTVRKDEGREMSDGREPRSGRPC
jgi:ankyrin repeat protein